MPVMNRIRDVKFENIHCDMIEPRGVRSSLGTN